MRRFVNRETGAGLRTRVSTRAFNEVPLLSANSRTPRATARCPGAPLQEVCEVMRVHGAEWTYALGVNPDATVVLKTGDRQHRE